MASVMSMSATMIAQAEEYLSFRRKLGFALASTGRSLRAFGLYADRIGHRGPVSTSLAVQWATLPGKGGPKAAAKKLEAVRQFAKHRVQFDLRTEVPPDGILGSGYRRRVPHIYSDEELIDLLRVAEGIGPRDGLRSRTYVTLFALLASTGMRVGEALRLKCVDVDLEQGVIQVNKAKFRKSRLVPIHASATNALRAYAVFRDGRRNNAISDSFFVDGERQLGAQSVRRVFAELRQRLGWRTASDRRAPRAYDLRHTFAVRRLLRWYREGANIDEKISALSTYLGHVRVTDTYWYLTATPELMAVSGARFERYADSHAEEERC